MHPLRRLTIRTCVLALCVSSFLSCDKNQLATIDDAGTPPSVVNAAIIPDTLNLDSLTPNGDMYTVNVTIEVKAVDSEGQATLVSVAAQVLSPYTLRPVGSAALRDDGVAPDNTASDSVFTGMVQFAITRASAGSYRVTIVAKDGNGLGSNTLEQTLYLVRNNSVPHLSLVTAPDTLVRPSSGFRFVLFAVSAADSDGYDDIANVFFKQISPTPSSTIAMFDDGDLLNTGDRLAGDGIFSRIVLIDSSNTLGDKVFLFQARDRAGALSDSLLHTVTVIHD